MRQRIALTLRQVADQLDPPKPAVLNITVKLDGRSVAEQIVRHTLKQAAVTGVKVATKVVG